LDVAVLKHVLLTATESSKRAAKEKETCFEVSVVCGVRADGNWKKRIKNKQEKKKRRKPEWTKDST
jgi:hypothetical protein